VYKTIESIRRLEKKYASIEGVISDLEAKVADLEVSKIEYYLQENLTILEYYRSSW
jgi:hypothetical protein